MAKTVLLVDDDMDIHTLAKKALAPLECVVAEAYDGNEALSMVSRVRPEVLLVDLTMPRVDGWTFIRKYRELTGADTPIVVMTSRSGFFDKTLMAKLADVSAYVTKPFDPRELRTIVRELLEKGKCGKS
ncbi:MAG: response regulator [Armatimonadetes bacterium]|nr:response regulator [Armatimonadota bacterium]PIU60690.1 MAG: hypothetical protein COS85_23100 [Armatimonadetes bacterium CG07_land_8_20_14_0_80_59_28]PIX38825.1 MAG: hypothetical protein COZ56_19465 [Armatimonadetes bacterium CG_4_8_14_3_um_filter_58_9]PIY46162.1 MAG: hypothetical protein COZ05_05975 [Armatimonadetes bacterium CG_4_10_14_3_um_filter_59_10]